MVHELLVVDLLEALSSKVECTSSAKGGWVGHGEEVDDVLKPCGGPSALTRMLKKPRRRAGGVEVTKAVRRSSTNVVLQSHQLVASSFALGKDMIASRQVFGAIALLSQVEEPRGLLKLVVTLKASSKEGLVGHQLDSRSASAKRRLLSALVAEAGKVEDCQFNSRPVRLPEAVQVASLDSLL